MLGDSTGHAGETPCRTEDSACNRVDADPRDDDGITLFDSTGLAIQDLAIAKAAHAKAHELDLQRLEL